MRLSLVSSSVCCRLRVFGFLLAGLVVPCVARAQTESVLANFTGTAGAAPGANPLFGNLIQASDGNFYGLTYSGGTDGDGAAFKMTPAGVVTLLHSFAGGTGDGQNPDGSLVQGTDGNFYGLTEIGGANNMGAAFKMTAAGAVTLLHSFAGAADGEMPTGSLVQGTDGNFYGLTQGDGTHSYGAAFQMTPAGVVTVLHTFTATGGDGGTPFGSPVQGTDGNFYGMTYVGGTNGYGVVFKMTATGAVTLLHSFTGGEGGNPYGSLVQGTDGNFYGLTSGGGANGFGMAFKMTSGGAVTLLHSFAGGTGDGSSPFGSMVQGADGNFYGMTYSGGSSSSDGVIFRQTPATTLAAPVALNSSATTVAPGGAFQLTYSVANAYTGTTNGTNMGSGSLGYCFASNTAENTTWTGVIAGSPTAASSPSLTAPSTAGTYTYSLTCGGMESNLVTLTVPPVPTVTGVAPTSGGINGGTSVTLTGTGFTGATAVKFGTANATGITVVSATKITATSPAGSAGVVDVRVTTPGGTSATSSSDQFTYLRASVTFGTMSFSPAASEPKGTSQVISISEAITYGGVQPTGAVTFVLNGVTYTATCTTSNGIETCTATVPAATIAALAAGGYTVTAALAQDSAYNAGSGTSGTFTITPPNVVLASFTGTAGAAPGANPQGGNLIQASDGNFYGLTSRGGANGYGAAFKVTPAGVVTLLHSFAGTADGAGPYGSLVQGTDGNFYGLTQVGGANNDGVAFKMTSAGGVTLLHSFAGGSGDGQQPYGSVVQSTDGNFYGVTFEGGANNDGVAFKMTPAGSLTLLHSFAGAADGAIPAGSLVQGTDGNFYGLTYAGGANGGGAAFKMTPAGAVTLLYSFAATATDGSSPLGSLVQGTDGNFYGLTYEGGANGEGAAFRMTPAGVETVLHSFGGTATDGSEPEGSLVEGTDGNLYGLVSGGGANTDGAAFLLTAGGAYTLLNSFGATATDGMGPNGSLVQGADGNFYGMTTQGGSSNDGVIFKQTTATTLAAPVALSSSATTVYTGGTFTLTYSVANAYTGSTNGTNAGSGSLGYCFASNTAGNTTWTGVIAGSPTAATSPSLTAPSTAGTYTYSLTCGGMESNLVTLTVQTPPPVVTVPSNITAEATSAAGAVVTFTATATDTTDGTDPVTCAPASGSTFALGTTLVTCSSTDSHGSKSTKTFTVTVQDTTAPAITVPSNKTVEATGPAGAVVTYTATATDAVDGSVAVTCAPTSGSTFAVGMTQVTCSSTDSHGNKATKSFTVTVRSTTHFTVVGYATTAIVTEGGTVAVSALDGNGNVDPYFTGTVTLTSSDAKATLPAAYTFQSSDNGVHTFNVTLNTLGTQSITATSGSASGAQAGVVVGDAIWVLNGAGSLVKLNAAGSAVGSGAGASGTSSFGGIAFDSTGDVFSVSTGANSLAFATYAGGGATISTGGGLNAPVSVAVDGAGSVWVANSGGNTISEFSHAGAAVSPASGYGTNDLLNAPSGIAVDAAGGLWVANKGGNSVTHVFGAATPAVTPLARATANATTGTRP